jgi:WD repeat-containing protein 44
MWDILDHRVVDWTQTPTMITAAAFNHNGKIAAAGLYNGQVVFFQSQGLTYFTQIDCRNRHGKHKHGRKVTGLQFTNDGKQILISTNDSRIRLYDMDDYSMSMKYKGHENETLQIRAHFSEDNQFIISGSDDSEVFVWATNKDYSQSLKGPKVLRNRNDRNDSYEYFKAHSGIVTVALMGPERTLLFATRAWPQGGPIRHLIVAAGYDGNIKVFENRGDALRI